MKDGTFKKAVGIGILVLFLGTGVLPATGTIVMERSSMTTFDGNTLYVGGVGPNNYSTIQDGIDNASGGDTVFVYDDSSPYYEHVIINKVINLIGENKDTTIIDGSGWGNVVFVASELALVTITGFTITNGTMGISFDSRVTNATISRNIITKNGECGISFSGFCEYNTISENVITNNINGTYFSAGSYTEIYGNTFAENTDYGLVFMIWCNENTIHYNNFMKNTHNVIFVLSALNKWSRNYWDRPRILPKLIPGMMGILPWFNVDFRPLILPHQIPSQLEV